MRRSSTWTAPGLQRLRAEGVAVIDVRRPEEWRKTGVIEGSHLLTFFDKKGRYDLDEWLPAFSAIAESDQPVALICRSGNRSGKVARMLDEQFGYRQVYNVQRRHPGMARRGALHRGPPVAAADCGLRISRPAGFSGSQRGKSRYM